MQRRRDARAEMLAVRAAAFGSDWRSVSERLRVCDYVDLQALGLDVSFRHVAGVNRRYDGAA